MKPFLNAFRLMYLAQKINLFSNRYMSNGLKPSEAFHSDICNYLVKWAAADGAIYFETKRFWYCFMMEDTDVGNMAGIIWMRRFELDSSNSISCFINKTNRESLRRKWKFDKQTDSNKVPVQ